MISGGPVCGVSQGGREDRGVDAGRRLEGSRRILVVKLRYIGDSLWTLPYLANLAENLPSAEIAVLAPRGAEGFFRRLPHVHRLFSYTGPGRNAGISSIPGFLSLVRDLRRYGPDTAIDLTDSDRPALLAYLSGARLRITYAYHDKPRNRLFTHVVRPRHGRHMVGYHLHFLRSLGLRVFDERIILPADPDATKRLLGRISALEGRDGRKKILVHPGARVPLREWGAEKFARLIDSLGERYRVFLVAGPGEDEVLREVVRQLRVQVIVCPTDLGVDEFAALCGEVDLFIGNDSGPIHIAATRTFVVGIYGPNTDELAGPWTENKRMFGVEGLPCRPCDQKKCVNPEYKACLERISPDEVAVAIRDILG
jgi:ADP-heptose:LPS heptosyltransferase